MKKIKERLFEIIQTAKDGNKASKVFDIIMVSLIIINVILVIADTFKIPEWCSSLFYYVEVFSVTVFTVEYILRVYTADFLYPNLSPTKAKVRYIFSFMAIVDLLAILPFYIPFIIPIDLRVLRLLRITRLLRIFKVNRYTDAFHTIARVFSKKKSQLLSSVFVVLILMIIASVLMYGVENEAQPQKFDNVFDSLWWAVATLTTVGYGDIYPVTVLGKILSAVIALLGIGLVAVPSGIISAGFIEIIDENRNSVEDEKQYCPYCGKKIR